jgi:hypothetical protein
MAPSAASWAPWRTASGKPVSRMTWSAGITSSTGSAPSRLPPAPPASAPAPCCGPPARARWSRACPSAQLLGDDEAVFLVAHHHRRGQFQPAMPSTRRTVACSSESSPISGSSCLGYFSRDSGHRRVPEPPDTPPVDPPAAQHPVSWSLALSWIQPRASPQRSTALSSPWYSVVAVAVHAVLGRNDHLVESACRRLMRVYSNRMLRLTIAAAAQCASRGRSRPARRCARRARYARSSRCTPAPGCRPASQSMRGVDADPHAGPDLAPGHVQLRHLAAQHALQHRPVVADPADVDPVEEAASARRTAASRQPVAETAASRCRTPCPTGCAPAPPARRCRCRCWPAWTTRLPARAFPGTTGCLPVRRRPRRCRSS